MNERDEVNVNKYILEIKDLDKLVNAINNIANAIRFK